MSEQKSPPLSHPVGVLHEIRWSEICPWLILVRSLRASLLVRVLMLSCMGVLLTQLGWTSMDRLFSEHPAQLQSLTETAPRLTLLDVEASDWVRENPLVHAWSLLSQPLLRVFGPTFSYSTALSLVCSAIWAILVWAIFGGAISRISAMQCARGETLGSLAALKAAFSTFTGTAGAPLIALLGAVGLAVPLMLAGLVIRWDSLVLLTGLAWIFVLAWGVLLTVVLLGLLMGWPLIWATMAVERSDAFDAVSRCYAYVYQRPLQLAFYVFVAGGLGMLGEAVVYYFSSAAVHLSEWSVRWGAGDLRTTELTTMAIEGNTQLSGSAATGAKVIYFWKEIWMAIAASYPMAYLWSSAVGIYLLLRRHIDSTEMDEIVLAQHEKQQGHPELEKNSAGSPEAKSK